MQIIVSDKWLKTCGLDYLSGKAMEVTKSTDFNERGIFYEVVRPNRQNDFNTLWTVWSFRGVTVID